MKILLITDQHFGVRNDNQHFIDHYRKFYEEVVIPFVDANKIDTIINLGDTFDKRRSINFMSLEAAKEMWFDPLKERDVKMHMLIGNHDIYYKNTLRVNAPNELLGEYENITAYTEPTTVMFDGLPILFLPWICDENYDESLRAVNESSADICMGHLELNGFVVTQQILMDHGLDMKYFKKFEKTFSGHFHTRSNNDNIYYLGNPYEIYWNDYDSDRGFHFFDTETLEHTPVNNPYKVFYKIFYDDTDHQTFDSRPYEDKIVKLIVRKKTDIKKFEKFIDKLYASNISELKIVENFEFGGYYKPDDFEAFESEDTMSILNRYIDDSEITLDKSVVQKIMQDVYQEACEVV